MEWIEIAGKSVEEAQERALEVLGVERQDAEFELVADAKLGLFGRVKTEARVRARVRPATPRPKDDGNRKRRRNGRERPERAEKPERNERPKQTKAAESTSEEDAEVETEETSESGSTSRGSARRRRGGRSRSGGSSSTVVADDAFEGDSVEDVALPEQLEVAREFLEGLVRTAGADATVASRIDEDEQLIFLDVTGESLGHLIGPRGVTLQSVQELTRTVVQRKTGARNGRIIVDIAAYREKRKEALERFTRQVAEEVKASGEAKSLEPMSPPDRKIVHDTINTLDGVETTSEGEEPRRRVVIRPAS